MTPPAGATIRCRLPRVSIAGVTLGALPGGRRRLASAIAATVAVHGCLCLWAVFGAGEGSPVRRPVLARTTEVVQMVELAVPAPPQQPAEARAQPLPAKGPLAPAAKRTAAPVAPAPTESVPPALAAAAAVITAETAAPVDLTSDTVVTGNAAAFAGGITSPARGTNTIQSGATVPGTAASGPAGAVDHSSSVSLEGRSWSCPWPPEADAAQIERQTVVIRVMVNADGAVLSAEAVSDPGNGFGAAAIACALGTRFTAARDRAGNSIRARSPPIRVTFIR